MIESIKIVLIAMLAAIVMLQEVEVREMAKELAECDPNSEWGWFQ